MSEYFDIWRFAAGLGVFLLGMNHLERALRELVGPAFRRFIRDHTHNPLKGIAAGTVATAVLQSSSVVGLMVLAFVGAGALSLRDAIGVIMGANVGTTFTGWIVATLGFKFELEGLALPLVGIGGLSYLFLSRQRPFGQYGQIALGLGFLLLGLTFMKESVDQVALNMDLALFREYGLLIYFLVGVVFTAIVQSSSATMMICLSALAAGVFDISTAAAVVVGADLGTTVTVFLGAIRGSAAKRRVAVAHFLINVVTVVIAMSLLPTLIYAIQEILGLRDPLYGLVLFHSVFNVIGILPFLPALTGFADLLERSFEQDAAPGQSVFVDKVPTAVPETAIEAMELEVGHLIGRVVRLNMDRLELEADWNSPWPGKDRGVGRSRERFSERYEVVKQLEGELLEFAARLRAEEITAEIGDRLNQLLHVIRNAVHSAKALKDVSHNLEELRHESTGHLKDALDASKPELASLFAGMATTWSLERPAARFEALAEMIRRNHELHDHRMTVIYDAAAGAGLKGAYVSTLLNVDREIFSSTKALLLALKDFLLEPEEAEDLSGLPGA